VTVQGRVLVAGTAQGPLLRLAEPISFWGGVDPASGRITQPRHPDHQRCISGQVLALPGNIGSSSSSAILLELMYNNRAPLALLLAEPDAILALGVVVAREMGYGTIPVIHCDVSSLPGGGEVQIDAHGGISPG